MSQFKFFQELPKELRDDIWDLAIRDDSPAAHFFTVYDVWWDSIIHPGKVVHNTSDRFSPSSCVGLAAPQARGANELSWVDGNKSVYMTDSGLWTACWESRERMLWHFRPATPSPLMWTPTAAEPEPVPEPEPALDISRKSTKAVTMRFRRDNGERQYLTIQPEDDLLCFQFAKGSGIPLEKGNFWCCIQDLPPFQRWIPAGRPLIRDIAVEYDPAWYKHVQMPWGWLSWPVRGFPRAGEAKGLARFWLINYALDRRYRPDGDRSGRRTFRTGGGLEFVEVLACDNEWWDRSGGSDAVDSSGPGESVAHRLARHMQSSQPIAKERPLFGVLACVRSGSEKGLPAEEAWMKGFMRRLRIRWQGDGGLTHQVWAAKNIVSEVRQSCLMQDPSGRKNAVQAGRPTAGSSAELSVSELERCRRSWDDCAQRLECDS